MNHARADEFVVLVEFERKAGEGVPRFLPIELTESFFDHDFEIFDKDWSTALTFKLLLLLRIALPSRNQQFAKLRILVSQCPCLCQKRNIQFSSFVNATISI